MVERGSERAAARFWAQVVRAGPVPPHAPHLGPCWLWAGPCRPDDLGVFRLRGRLVAAHRVAYELAHGPLAPGTDAYHRCRLPPCCNPAHLFAGPSVASVVAKLLGCWGATALACWGPGVAAVALAV